MSELVANCPRCGSKEMTFDLRSECPLYTKHSWQYWCEVFCICRKCLRPTIFVLSQKAIGDKEIIKKGLTILRVAVNNIMSVERYISLRDVSKVEPPEYIPENIKDIFNEGTACLSIDCYNAAGTMFRLCIDLVTKKLLPEGEVEGLNQKIRRDLGLRLPWLFDNSILPKELKELSSCIKDNGNDGAHDGTLKREDAEDLLDFTLAVLERIFTEPKRLQLAKERRILRRSDKN